MTIDSATMTGVRAPQHFGELSPAARELAALLPGVQLARNESVPGRPLFVLLEVLGEQLAELETAIEKLLADQFVETASPTALTLMADLVGARLTGDDPRAHRAVVGRTLHWRRRKGNLATLEEVLTVTSGWDAEVDEAFRSLLLTQDLAHPVPWRGRTATLWDPVALADPLTRRSPAGRSPRDPDPGPFLARRPGEDVEQTLRRVGGVDAGRYAASPRTVDLLGWAQPDRAVIRTSRLEHAEFDRVEIGEVRTIAHRSNAAIAFAGFALDPLGRDQPLVGRSPVVPPDAIAELTALHEPAAEAPPVAFRHGMLTPTALAFDGDNAEKADVASVFIDGVRLIGPDPAPAAGLPLAFAPVGPAPVVRFADSGRPGPTEEWDLRIYALDEQTATIPATVLVDPALPGDENPVLLRTLARRGGRDPETVSAAATTERAGASVAIRISRPDGSRGSRRRPDGTWDAVTPGAQLGDPRSPVTAVQIGGATAVVRVERRATGLALAHWRPDQAADRWASSDLPLDSLADPDLPDLDAGADGPALGMAAHGTDLLLIAPVAADDPDEQDLGVWRISDLEAPAPTIERLAGGSRRHPPSRTAPSVLVDGDRLLIFGGEQRGRVLDDLWSVPLTGADAGQWRSHVVRNRQARTGGILLPTPGGVVLLGGSRDPGVLDVSVHRIDLARRRPSWTELASVPLPPERPGVLFAQTDPANPAAIEVLAWADSVRPVLLRSDPVRDWLADEPDDAAPNPPADGEALFLAADFLVTGPSPLPPSEIIFSLGGDGRIAFLPAVDPGPEPVLFTVYDDGSTVRWLPPGTAARPTLRLGAGRAAPTDRRPAPAPRVGVPGRLAWRPLRLRQMSLGPWDSPLALTLEDGVGLDPRLGRVLVRREIADGAASASFRIGRAARLGAGFAPAGGTVPASWIEAGDAVPALPTVPTGWVSPRTAGLVAPDGNSVASRLGDALAVAGASGSPAASGDPAVRGIAVLGSPLLPAEVLVAGQQDVVAVWASDSGGRPHVAAEGAGPQAMSYSLHERLAVLGGEDPDAGPGWSFVSLSLAGGVELAVAAGRLDLRWCTVATPGAVAVRVAGAGHSSPLLRHSLPRPRVLLRLYGCQLGVVELPPWVRLIAAGCTFDAGAREVPAINAPGADVHLQHCTVHGRTVAGSLHASSSAFGGAISGDRPDLGWVRYCLLPAGGRPPLSFRSRTHPVSFASQDPLSPAYLMLDANNGAAVLRAGEHGHTPGAHDDRAHREAELDSRTDDFLPLALFPIHIDRAAADLDRMNRRIR